MYRYLLFSALFIAFLVMLVMSYKHWDKEFEEIINKSEDVLIRKY
jgi:hypothetical protein